MGCVIEGFSVMWQSNLVFAEFCVCIDSALGDGHIIVSSLIRLILCLELGTETSWVKEVDRYIQLGCH